MWQRATLLFAVAALLSLRALAGQTEFCNGFAEGYRSIRGDAAVLPSCPQERSTPHWSNSFREGVKAGIQVGRRK